ncbi:right-handed parallel beta-helix repeat-containing protein [Lentzea kentuckyensis]|uniref:right-handed parallel beta-helix repeat-containing protein n=1 Tax=Lentzea kentuckyensis TaxID=360086 RepID=UPI00117A33E9|nr:right-handed parallel beta-helix repeat-containing protein [Lentzea kentuckyensis]
MLVTAAVAAVGLAVPLPTSAAPSRELYAAPAGSGTACTQAAPCSLTGVRAKVRALAGSMTTDIDVRLRGGTYRLAEPFTLGPADSGANGHRVVYSAYGTERPVFSGARQVSGFSLSDSSRNIYRAAVPPGTTSRQLFVNGQRAQRARGPLDPGGFTLKNSSFTTADTSYRSFTNASAVEVVYNRDWKHMRCPLAGITEAAGGGSSLNVAPGCFANNNSSVPNLGFPFNGAGLPKLEGISWVENAYQLLDEPGEFYLDTTANQLYYKPRPGENLATAAVDLPVLEKVVDLSGTPGHLAPVNDTDPRATYSPSWRTAAGRPYGDFDNDVHYTQVNGDSMTFAFTGTGVDVLTEVNTDAGAIDVYVDGTKTRTVSANGPVRLAQQPVVSVTGLSAGRHTVKLVKTGGDYLVVDGFVVIPDRIAPVHDITFRGVTFAHTTWNLPSTAGYVDNQAGVLWDAATRRPIRIPAAVQVHRGRGIVFTDVEIAHTGGTGIDLADGTQESTITRSWIHDTSGGSVSLGEVDDYYVTDPNRMTSGDIISQNVIEYVGQDYQDAVGIWTGYTRRATLANNEIAHTPYSGISMGWGWGWAASCELQAKQSNFPVGSCRRGTNYAGDNKIVENYVYDVMGVLHDGGHIYTNGGQGGHDDTLTSEFRGNVLSGGSRTNNMIYQDEGSSKWDTHHNVIHFANGSWTGMWTPTIHDIRMHDNFHAPAGSYNRGTNVVLTNNTEVKNGDWPPAAQDIIKAAGLPRELRANRSRLDDFDLSISYHGSWIALGFRGLGDFHETVHAAHDNGDSATMTFTGAGVRVIGEKNSDQGDIEVFVDDVSKGVISTSATSRQVQQTLYTADDLNPAARHTVRVVKRSGQYATLDGFLVCATLCEGEKFTATTVAPVAVAGGDTQVITLSGTSLYQSDTVRVTPRGGAPISATVRSVSADRTVLTAEVNLGSARTGAATVEVRSHFSDVQPVVLTKALTITKPVLRAGQVPAVSGQPAVGQTLSASTGDWQPVATSHSYQWAADGVAIKGATHRTCQLPVAALGKRITVTVTASRPGASPGSATSAPTEPVGQGAAPKATTKPVIYGLPRAGLTVHATSGIWSPRPDAHRYEWRLNGEVIPGAATSKLTVTASMAGRNLTVTVVAVEAGRADGVAESRAVTVRG